MSERSKQILEVFQKVTGREIVTKGEREEIEKVLDYYFSESSEEIYSESSEEIYSGSEVVIGKYMNKPLYRKVVDGVFNSHYAEVDISSLNMETCITRKAIISNLLQVMQPDVFTPSGIIPSLQSNIFDDRGTKKVTAHAFTWDGSSFINAQLYNGMFVYFILEYTKTTDPIEPIGS